MHKSRDDGRRSEGDKRGSSGRAPIQGKAPAAQERGPAAYSVDALAGAVNAPPSALDRLDSALAQCRHAVARSRSCDDEGGGASPPVPGGGGEKMPAAVQARMEGSFGADFSGVRIHQGVQARSLGAEAFARGADIHFAPGRYEPHSGRGQELLGHELAHVVQQKEGRVQATTLAKGLRVSDEPALEREADALGARAARGEPAGGASGSLVGGVPRSRHWGPSGGPVQRRVQWGAGAPASDVVLFKKEDDAAPEAEAPDPAAEQARKELEEFKSKTYEQANHHPSTGRGAFDVAYLPTSGDLNITVRTDFVFEDTAGAAWSNSPGVMGAVERLINTTTWMMEYMRIVQERWSGRYGMRCSKKYWESLVANTKAQVQCDPSNPHYRLTVKKLPVGDSLGSGINTTGNPAGAPGDNPAWVGTLGGHLDSNDTTIQNDFRSGQVARGDSQRMRDNAPKKILFESDSEAVPATDVASLQQLGQMLSMTRYPVLSVNLTGRASTDGDDAHNLDLSRRRAESVAASVRSGGGTIVHNLNVIPKGEEGAGAEAVWRRVDIEIPDLPATFKNDYDVASHEFGHEIGLHDEYPNAARAAHYELVEEAFGERVAKTFTSREARSGSLMSSGLDVRPYHYVTFWEALGRVTSPTLTRSDWKIEY